VHKARLADGRQVAVKVQYPGLLRAANARMHTLFLLLNCYQPTFHSLQCNAGRQVHKARLADGRQVAVKVQYPGLRGAANADLTTLGCLSRCAQALFPEFRLGWLFEELQLKLTEELGECHAARLV
jgi:predicted unusual protein kinase regulating ubiquinone biosynthesis (AarF/ABC1/UbiB family)